MPPTKPDSDISKHKSHTPNAHAPPPPFPSRFRHLRNLDFKLQFCGLMVSQCAAKQTGSIFWFSKIPKVESNVFALMPWCSSVGMKWDVFSINGNLAISAIGMLHIARLAKCAKINVVTENCLMFGLNADDHIFYLNWSWVKSDIMSIKGRIIQSASFKSLNWPQVLGISMDKIVALHLFARNLFWPKHFHNGAVKSDVILIKGRQWHYSIRMLQITQLATLCLGRKFHGNGSQQFWFEQKLSYLTFQGVGSVMRASLVWISI